MAAATDRYVVRSFTAVGTADIGGVQIVKRGEHNGLNILIQATGNFEANLLADHFGDGGFTDVTTFLFGAATFTSAKKFGFLQGYLPWAVRLNVTSVQAANSVRFAVGF